MTQSMNTDLVNCTLCMEGKDGEMIKRWKRMERWRHDLKMGKDQKMGKNGKMER
jgi:hypothetical protein